MLHDDNFIYMKIPKLMGSALIKSVIQAIISCKYDNRSDPQRLDATEFILLQHINELANTEKITETQASILNHIFEPPQKEETNE